MWNRSIDLLHTVAVVFLSLLCFAAWTGRWSRPFWHSKLLKLSGTELPSPPPPVPPSVSLTCLSFPLSLGFYCLEAAFFVVCLLLCLLHIVKKKLLLLFHFQGCLCVCLCLCLWLIDLLLAAVLAAAAGCLLFLLLLQFSLTEKEGILLMKRQTDGRTPTAWRQAAWWRAFVRLLWCFLSVLCFILWCADSIRCAILHSKMILLLSMIDRSRMGVFCDLFAELTFTFFSRLQH